MEVGTELNLSTKHILGSVLIAGVLLITAAGAVARAQTANPGQSSTPQPSAQKELMAEDVYKNIQVLKGIPENQFLATMGFFSASIGESCEFCHDDESSWAGYAKDNEHKQTARKMILMMNAINKSYFGGARKLTCYSCHRGTDFPKVTPDLALQYSAPTTEEPDLLTETASGEPSADQIIDKYIQALGGAQRLSAITSFVAKGSYQGYAELDKSPIEIMAKAPGQRVTIIHTSNGDWTTTYDGRNGWVAEPGRPVPLLQLTGEFLKSVKVDADLAFPGRIRQSFSRWVVGFPTTINDREAEVVQGSDGGDFPVKLYFDKETGLLLRQVRYTNSPVGLNPIQVDYTDYREVGGVKMPFRWTTTWTDGKANTELADIQVNVPLDDAKFAKPAAPAAGKPASR
ncbi:MAG TPA: photosynthetic reaction center cytochrome c subunit family protein [Candidatus Acidoferrales bacterium]|jgi:outer membrane lipoprotein-sorting protein|nr:photosynthetic reaction center cytochrome c subunit family protein [Candidatus Acidoferrales bacterium]